MVVVPMVVDQCLSRAAPACLLWRKTQGLERADQIQTGKREAFRFFINVEALATTVVVRLLFAAHFSTEVTLQEQKRAERLANAESNHKSHIHTSASRRAVRGNCAQAAHSRVALHSVQVLLPLNCIFFPSTLTFLYPLRCPHPFSVLCINLLTFSCVCMFFNCSKVCVCVLVRSSVPACFVSCS